MEERTGHRLRVATLNVWSRHGDWPRRRAALRDGFDALRPDLVALQESVVIDGYDQVLDVLGDGWHVEHQADRTSGGVGCSIASRAPHVRVEEVDLRVTDRVHSGDGVGRSAVVEIDTVVGVVAFVNHKPSWELPLELERELQAVRTATAVEEFVRGRDVHVVLAGDFDARPDSASVRFWTGRQALHGMSVQYLDAWEAANGDEPGHTFTEVNPLIRARTDWSRIPPRRIDYVMVRCDDRGPTLLVHSCERFLDRPVGGIWASDHFGVVADLVVPAAVQSAG